MNFTYFHERYDGMSYEKSSRKHRVEYAEKQRHFATSEFRKIRDNQCWDSVTRQTVKVLMMVIIGH